jgi:alpha-N-arabinofuranosidase
VGRQSARIVAQAGEGKPFVAGIAQDGIAVRAGEELTIELYARSDDLAGAAIHVLIGRNYGTFFRAYAAVDLHGVAGEWGKLAGTLTPAVSDTDATLAIGVTRPATLWLDKVSLMPADNRRGWRADVVEAIRALRPGIIRFGGSSLIFYQWQMGIGPRQRRAAFENRPWGNMEENDVGLHEFLEFCEMVAAEPMICLNSNSTTLEHILDEIEYCNGPADSRYGSERAAMGHPLPFNVKYWQIGNEQSGEEYERVMVAYAAAIRQRHPDLVLLASYPSDNILDNLASHVDYICPHFYDAYTPAREDDLRRLIDRIQASPHSAHLKLGITEWNHTASHWGWARSWLLTLYNALNAGRMFHMYQRLGDVVTIANRSNMTNSCCSGILQTNRADIYFTPCYYVQRAYANLCGDRALRVEVAPGDPLDVAATSSSQDGTVALSVVNYAGGPQARRIDVAGRGLVDVWTLAGPSLDAVNSFVEKERIAPQESRGAWDGGTFDHTFPAYSVTILRFRRDVLPCK